MKAKKLMDLCLGWCAHRHAHGSACASMIARAVTKGPQSLAHSVAMFLGKNKVIWSLFGLLLLLHFTKIQASYCFLEKLVVNDGH